MRTIACASLCLLLLCSGVALGQMVDDGVQQDVTGTEVSSSVPASVDSGTDFKLGPAAIGSGSSARAAAIRATAAVEASSSATAAVESSSSATANPGIDSEFGRARLGGGASPISRREKLTTSQISQLKTSLDQNKGYRHAPASAQRSALSTRSPSASNNSGQGAAANIADFPDSTRGTGAVSPPDPGTVSPLDGTFGFNPGLPEFGTGDLLNPTLRVGKRSTGTRGRRDEKLRAQRNGLSQKRPSLLSPDQQLEPNILTQPSASDPLSIDQQLGLQNDLSSGPLDHQ